MSTVTQDIKYVRAYTNDLLILTSSTWEDHLEKLEKVFTCLQAAGLKISAKKSFFGRGEFKYLGYWITRNDIQPVAKEVGANHEIDTLTNKKQLKGSIGMVNY